MALFRQVVSGFPKSDVVPLAQFGMGAALYEKGDFKGAAASLQQLINKHAKHVVTGQGRRLRGSCLREL